MEIVKKPLIKRNNSHPDVLTQTTVFCPYVDLRMGKKGEATNVVQRKIVRVKRSQVTGNEGEVLDFKKCDYIQYRQRFPWLLKNAHFAMPGIRDFELMRIIGVGRTGKVGLVKMDRAKYCVIKSIRKNGMLFQNNELRHLIAEREALYDLNHTFCMRLFAEFEDQGHAYFAFEYVPGGELRSLLVSNQKLSSDAARFYASEILLALEHMHSLHIVHRDLRPENILIDEEGHIKLVDFGYAMKTTSTTNGKLYTICCPAPYLSPELLNSKYQGGYGKEVDLWAFAVVLYEMMVGHTPFALLGEDSQYEIFLAILESRIQYPTFFDSSAKELLKEMFLPEIDKRLQTVQGVKEHGYFADHALCDWTAVVHRRLRPPFVPDLSQEGDSRCFALTEGSVKHVKRLKGLENQLKLS
jgi:serine/threonine protein kinase